MAVLLTACGQKGALFLPTEPASLHRATVFDTLRTGTPAPATPAASAPSVPASTP